MLEQEVYPWERQPDESPRAFEAFTVYRDMGVSRSQRKVGQNLGKSRAQIYDWASKHNWLSRASAWDAEQDRVGRIARLDAIKDMNERHAKLGRTLQAKALAKFAKMTDAQAVAMSVNEARRLIDVGAKLERAAMGEPESIQRVEGEVTHGHSGSISFIESPDFIRAIQQTFAATAEGGNPGSNPGPVAEG